MGKKKYNILIIGWGSFLVFLAFFCLFLGIFVRGAIFLVPPIAFLANIILLAYHNMINIRADGDRAAHIEWPCHLLNLLNPFIILSFALVYSGYGLSVDGTIREKIALMAGDGSIFYVNVIIALSLLLILWRHGYTDRVNGYERWRPDSAFILLTLSLSLFIPLLYILLILLIFIPLWQGILIGSKEKDNNFVKLMRWVRAKLTT